MKKSIFNFYKTIGSVISVPVGLLIYFVTGKTPSKSYQGLIWLFCISGGRLNDVISNLISTFQAKCILKSKIGILGDFKDEEKLKSIVEVIKLRGYVVFPEIVPSEIIERMHSFTSNTKALKRMMDGQTGSLDLSKEIYKGGVPKAVRYDYSVDDILDQPDVQDLISDGSILAIAEKYLNATPKADVLSMWWHTNFSDKPDSIAAQYFHFDMDRVKWLKIFIYLTDVDSESGPHSFVEGSHKTNGIPSHLLRKGYVRLSDEEIEESFTKEKIINFTGKKGTLIIEDTRGLHKGAHVTGNPRLMLQLQFSNSLFGTNYEKIKIRNIRSESLGKIIGENKEIYREYV